MKEGHGSGFPGHPVNVRDRPNTAPPGVELNNRGNNGSAPTFKSAYFAQSADPLRSAEDGAGGPRTQTGATPAKRAARWKVFAASFLVVAATGFLMVEPNFYRNVRYDVIDSLAGTDPAAQVDAQSVELPLLQYLDRHKRAIAANRTNFKLWDYFDLTEQLRLKGGDVQTFMWQDMVTLRIDLWVGKQRATGDMRHSIEKDKCVTIEVLRKLRLPHPTVRFMWRQAEYSAERLKAYLLDADYPAILKVGHIHQQKSTLFLPNKAAVQSKAAEYAEWTTEKMNSHFIDNNPVWMDSTNVLYAALDPCVFVQDVVNPGDFADGKSAKPLELMVEVMWGRAVHGVLTVPVRGEMALGKAGNIKNTEEFIVQRDGWVAYCWPKTAWGGSPQLNRRSKVMAHRLNNGISWFRPDPGSSLEQVAEAARKTCSPLVESEQQACISEYLEMRALYLDKYGGGLQASSLNTVWDVCSSFASGVGADYMRCDVFVTGDGSVSVNEISLSSNWGNALSPRWQAKLIELWTSGYADNKDCTGPGSCGAAFSGLFEGDLPSPTWTGLPSTI